MEYYSFGAWPAISLLLGFGIAHAEEADQAWLKPVQRVLAGLAVALAAIAGYFLYNLMATGVSYPIGVIADRRGHRRPALLVFSFLSFAAAAAFLALSSLSVVALVPTFLLGGTAAGAVEVAESALAGDQLPAQQRGSGFGLLAAVNSVGDFVASVWVSLVWTISSASLAFAGAAALAVAGALLAARIPSTADAGKIGEPQVSS